MYQCHLCTLGHVGPGAECELEANSSLGSQQLDHNVSELLHPTTA